VTDFTSTSLYLFPVLADHYEVCIGIMITVQPMQWHADLYRLIWQCCWCIIWAKFCQYIYWHNL